MGDGNLGIRVFGKLDMNATIKDINSQLSKIEKNNVKNVNVMAKLDLTKFHQALKTLSNAKLKDINIKATIDGKGFTEQLSKLESALKSLNDVQARHNQILKETKTVTKELDGSTVTHTQQVRQSGEIFESTTRKIKTQNQTLGEQSKSLKLTIQDYERLGEVQKRVNRESADGKKALQNTKIYTPEKTYDVKSNSQGQVVDVKTTENLKSQKTATESLIASQEKLRIKIKELGVNGNLTAQQISRISRSLDTTSSIAQVKALSKEVVALEQVEKNRHRIKLAQQKAELDATKLRTISPKGTVDEAGLNSYLNSMKQLTPTTANLNQKLKDLDLQYNKVAQGARNSAHAISEADKSFKGMLSTAMTKFPIWMLSATLFYAPIRAMQDMTTRLIEIDTLMVNLKRVMDAPDYRFPQILEESVALSDDLSSKLTDVLSVMGEFARLGFDGDILGNLAESAQMLQNISDLDAKGSVDTLTAAMNNFNISAEDSIDIVDKLNEVDNNFAISTKDLSDGIRKSASTAATFGVTIDELTGYIAGIGSTTRETGSIIGNGLKTIFARLTTSAPSETALNDLGISLRDVQGEMKPTSDILEELAGKWKTLSAEQQQNTGVVLAGKFQLSRFLALMNNWEIATDATNTAINSQGSAMREQAKYAESLEGRLNRLDTAWNAFTLSVGDAILTDAFIGMVEGAGNLANAFAKLIDRVGFLPIALLGTVGVISIFNKNLFSMITSFNVFGASSKAASTAMRIFGASTAYTSSQAISSSVGINTANAAMSTTATKATTAAGATKGLSVALRGLASATVVGAAIMLVGVAIEKVVKKFAEASEASKAMQESINTSVEALTTNKDEVEDLISKMQDLGGSNENFSFGDLDVEKQAEYMQIQQRLAEIYPEIVDHIDSAGIAHFKNAAEIEKEKEQTRELIELKKEEMVLRAKENIEDAKKQANDLKKQIDSKRSDLKAPNYIMSGDTSVAVDKTAVEKNALKQEIIKMEQELAGFNKAINKVVIDTAASMSKMEIPSNVSSSVKEFVGSLDFSGVSTERMQGVSGEIAKITEELTKAQEAGDTQGIENATNKLGDLGSGYGGVKIDVEEFISTLEKNKQALSASTDATDENGEAMEDMSESYADAIKRTEAAILGLTGANQEHVELTDNLLYLYEQYSNLLTGVSEKELQAILDKVELAGSTETLTAQEQALYSAYLNTQTTYEELLKLYPTLANSQDLVSMSKAEVIEWITAEALANDQLLKAVELSRDGQLTAEEDRTLNALQNTNNRINIINSEIQAIMDLAGAYKGYQDALNVAMNSEDPAMADRAGRAAMRLSNTQQVLDVSAKKAELATLVGEQKKYRSEISKIDGINAGASTRAGKALEKQAKANEKAAKAADKATKAIETQIKAYDLFSYAADKYANAQNRINASMAKYELTLQRFPKHTKSYRQALQQQAKLLQEQRDLVTRQYKDLEGQIGSGVFKPVGVFANGQVLGVITTESGASTASLGGGGTGGGMASGNSNEAKAWNFFKNAGFNDNATAGILGNLKQESRLDPKAKQYGGGPGRGIAQWSVGGRWDQLVKWAKSQKKNEWDINTQLEYLLLEINGKDSTGLSLLNKNFGGISGLKNAGSTSFAAKAFEKSYERAGKPNYTNRINYANDYKKQFGGNGNVSVASAGGGSSTSGSLGKATGVIGYAQSFVGKVPYVFGGQSLAKGIDCSAFTQQIIKKTTGYNLPRTTETQLKHGSAVSKNDIQAGDLVFFKDTYRKGVSHVTISMGGTKAIGAQSTGGVGVIDFGTGYWAKHYMTARRLNYSSSKNPTTGISYSGNPGGATAGGGSGGGSGSNILSDTTFQAEARSNATKADADLAKMTDEARQQLLQLKQELYGIDGSLEEIRNELVMSRVAEYDVKVSGYDDEVQRLQNLTYAMDENSEAYRRSLLEQRKVIVEKDKVLSQEIDMVKHLIKYGDISERTRYELEQKLKELENSKVENYEQREAKAWAIITSSMKEYQEQIEKTNSSINRMKLLRERMDVNSNEYRQSLEKEAEAIASNTKLLMEQMNTMERQSYYYKLTAEQEKERQKLMQEAQDQILANDNELENIQKELVDRMIEAVKAAYERRRDIEVKQIEESLKKEEEASQKRIKAINDEAKAYEDAIQRKIDAINSQYAEDNYQKGLDKLEKERLRIEKQLALLGGVEENDFTKTLSREDQARRIELLKQLQEVKEQIEDETTKHSIDKQIEALEKELEANQKATDDKLEAEDKKMEEVNKKAEEEIKAINWKYQEILNDEKKWNNLRKELLKGNTEEMAGILQEHLGALKDFGEDAMKELEISYTGLLTLLEQLKEAEASLGTIDKIEGSQNNSPNKPVEFEEKVQAWNKYLSNKRKSHQANLTDAEREKLKNENDELRKKWGFIDGDWKELEGLDINSINKSVEAQERIIAWNEYMKNKRAVAQETDPAKKKKLADRNAFLRDKYKFPDDSIDVVQGIDIDQIVAGTDPNQAEKIRDWYTYLRNKRLYPKSTSVEEKKRMNDENIALRAKWGFPDGSPESLGKLDPLKFHDGGIVGSKSSQLGEMLNKFFNTSPDEQIIKSLKGELQIPPKNFGNVIQNVQNLAASMARDNTPIVIDGGTQVDVHIGSFVGTRENANELKSILNTLKTRGRV